MPRSGTSLHVQKHLFGHIPWKQYVSPWLCPVLILRPNGSDWKEHFPNSSQIKCHFWKSKVIIWSSWVLLCLAKVCQTKRNMCFRWRSNTHLVLLWVFTAAGMWLRINYSTHFHRREHVRTCHSAEVSKQKSHLSIYRATAGKYSHTSTEAVIW